MILSTIIETLSLIIAGTMVGNELAVAVFVNPKISSLDDKTHAKSARVLAQVLGRVMPFWYAATLALNIAVIFIVQTHWTLPWWLSCISALLFAISIGFTIYSLVPINNSISSWNLDSLPTNWKKQRSKWDRLHEFRVVLLVIALITLVVSILLALEYAV